MVKFREITPEMVKSFLEGHDPMERIVSIECAFNESKVSIVYVNDKGNKCIKQDAFKPFLWCKNSAAVRLFGGDRNLIKKKLREYGISVKALITHEDGQEENERLRDGYKYMFFATKPMSNQRFQSFFTEAGVPTNPKPKKGEPEQKSNEFICLPPVEQYMIETGKRLFKGWDSYDEATRLVFDLETQGLNPRIHAIDQIGIRTNKGFERILTITGETTEERRKSELACIITFIQLIAELQPDVVIGHNSENFDWDFIIQRCDVLGVSLEDISMKYFKHPIFKQKKEKVLKLGGEMEYYKPTIMWGHTIVDSLHAVRRAQAIDSSFKSASLKYATKYLKLNKPNRVYVKGGKISEIWNETDECYAFNNTNGEYYKIDDTHPLQEGYETKSGRYIVERYLLDDLWETDKVEVTLNEVNFLLVKIMPTSFGRACTMGTAAVWRLIMLTWCFENNLAIPSLSSTYKFTGGLSRLLKVSRVDRIVKLDYNSLYPSIILTWNIATPIDITHIMSHLLNYMLTNREKYKEIKNKAGEEIDKIKEQVKSGEINADDVKDKLAELSKIKATNDKRQLPLKTTANGFFGSFGAANIFNFGDLNAAEMTTCIGRQSLRLLIYHFSHISDDPDYNYEPIVGDTDGFNFQMPKKFRYTEEHPYISNGKGRNTIKDKAYTGVDADVAEFEDRYFNTPWNNGIMKMGLGIDEYCDACIQFSRKNYCDLMPDGSIKLVGNTIKSRKMSGYLEKFIDQNIRVLLLGHGKEFLDNYYDYIDRIYNYQIPIRDIASKGNIKKEISEYINDCKELTKSGSKKSRQAWYELCIREGKKVNVSDTIYYVNTGTRKADSDVKRITHQYVLDDNGNEIELAGKVKTDILKKVIENGYVTVDGIEATTVKDLKTADKKKIFADKIVREEDEIILNCKLVPQYVLDDEEKDYMCSEVEGLEYNVEKYIEQFNKRITPLLVCFSREIRDDILIKNPDERKYFTEEQAQLVAGEPFEEGDQDTYEALMTPERKEIEFWLKVGKTPPFIDECKIDWDRLVEEHLKEKKEEEAKEFQEENDKYLAALAKLTKEDVDKFDNEGELPSYILDFMTLGTDMHLYFKRIPDKRPSTGGFIFEDIQIQTKEVDEFSL